MILEMDDGREVKLDDDVDDDTARMLKALVQTLEKNAKARADGPTVALKRLVEVTASLAEQVRGLAAAKTEKSDDAGLRKDIAALTVAINKVVGMKMPKEMPANGESLSEVKAGLARLEKIARAPTRFVYDATGEIVGGKKDV